METVAGGCGRVWDHDRGASRIHSGAMEASNGNQTGGRRSAGVERAVSLQGWNRGVWRARLLCPRSAAGGGCPSDWIADWAGGKGDLAEEHTKKGEGRVGAVLDL